VAAWSAAVILLTRHDAIWIHHRRLFLERAVQSKVSCGL